MKGKKKALLVVLSIILASYVMTNIMAYNFEYVNVSTQVNVTDAYPVIDSIIMAQNIELSAGTAKLVTCNLTITDYNGWDDAVKVNATLWDNLSTTYDSADNNNTHYTNASCTNTSNDGNYISYWSCGFNVWYYANASTDWICNATVWDTGGYNDTDLNTTTFIEYYALNVTSLIDYGDLQLGSYSSNMTADVSNIGNSNINVSVRGYGVSPNDGLAMNCQFGNITVENQRFSSNISHSWTDKTALTSGLQNISGVSMPKRVVLPTSNTTYWQLYVNTTNNPFGICNGTIEFNAESG